MEALFLKLANLSITASWLVLAILLIRPVFRKAPKWVYCLLWGLVALRLICPISIESTLSLIPSAEPLPQDIIYTASPKIQSGVGVIDDFVNPVLSSSMTPTPGASVNPTQIWSFVFAWVWVAGAAAMLLYALISYLFLRHRVATATLLRENIKQSERVDSPFVLGFFRPVIYLPYNIAEEDLDYVTAHEHAHIRRKDHWWKPLGFILLAIYWFNPLLWVAYVLLCRDIEVACDEKVIREMDKEDRRAYSAALLRCSVRHHAIAACPLAFGETGVKNRIKAVMNYKKPMFWIVLPAVAVTIIAAVCLLTVPKRDTYNIKIVVPAGSKEAFVYSDEEISPTRGEITVWAWENLGDTEVVLKPMEVRQENAYDEATYLTPGMPTKLTAEKGGWFKIGVNVQNPTDEDLIVAVRVKHIEVRVASETTSDGVAAPYSVDSSEPTLWQWFDYLDNPSEMESDLTLELPVFPDTKFRYSPEEIVAEKRDGSTVSLIQGMPIWNAYFCDVTGDGVPDLCATYSFGYGMIDTRFKCYDYQNGASYEMSDRGTYDYSLRSEGGYLYADKRAYGRSTMLATGRLTFEGGYLHIAYASDGQTESFMLMPGTTYVSWQCLYINPLSSYGPMNDSGYRYEIGKDSFSIIRLLGDAAVSEVNAGREIDYVGRTVDYTGRPVEETVPVSKWDWQEFPYTDEEWETFFKPGSSVLISDIHALYGEILYQPLDDLKFLLLADGDLLIVTLKEDTQMGTYIWSIYSLINETNMGVAQWEYVPMLSSRLPAFRFAFDMEYKEIFASCTGGRLVDFDSQSATQAASSDIVLTFPKGNAVYWSPMEEFNETGQASDTAIYFTCTRENGSQFSGTIYITASGSSDDRTIYTATLVGTGLHLSPNTETEGGVISMLTTDAEAAVTKYDLQNGDLELSPVDLSQYVFFTNSTEIVVTVKGDDDFEGTIILRDISQDNAEIGRQDVSSKDRKVIFTNLTAARLYRIEYDGGENCSVVVSPK